MSDRIIGFDTEVEYFPKLKYSLKTMIGEQFCRSDLFNCYIVSVSDGSNTWAGHPRDFNWQSIEGATLISHNAAWDETCYLEMVRRGQAPKLNIPAWHCSADMTSYICNRRSLDQAVEYLLGIKVSKAARSDAANKHWPADFSPEEQKQMVEYARLDPHYCWLLWTKFSHLWPEHERKLSLQTRRQGQRGVQINVDLLNQYLVATHEMKTNTEKLLPWLRDEESESWDEFDVKPTATKCIAEQCRRAGIPCPPIKSKEGEEAYADWEKQYSPTNLWIPALSSWRSINKLYGTFQTMKSRLRPDGTMPFGLKYFGAHTGRWSGDGKINFQNFRKLPIICTPQGLMETNEKSVIAAEKQKDETGKYPDSVRYAINTRHLIIPRPGKRMIVSDLSQIEPRCLAWLAGDFQTLDLVRAGMSLYEAFARTTFGFTGEKLDKKSMLYAEIKARVLALGYGAGWEKYIEMAQDYTGMDITEGDPEWITDEDGNQISGYGQRARREVAEYRAKNTKVTGPGGVWDRLGQSMQRSVGQDFIITLPSGRKLRYEKVRCERRIEPDENGKPRARSVFTVGCGSRRVITYSGKLCENGTQAFARDVFGEHLIALGDIVLFSSHDEAICEVDKDVSVRDIEAVMSKCPEWCPGLPVAAEAKEVLHYLK